MKALGAVGFGLMLILAACILLFWSEGRAVKTARALEEGAGLVISTDSATVAPENEGKLIHISGKLEPQGVPQDKVFGISAPGSARVLRKAEMLQWKEVETKSDTTDSNGNSSSSTDVRYQQTWSDRPIDSSSFKGINAPSNPPMPFEPDSFVVSEGKLGAFFINGSDLIGLGKNSAIILKEEDKAAVATLLGGSKPVALLNNHLMLSATPANPQIGDMRIKFEKVDIDMMSVVAVQTGNRLTPYRASNGNEVFLAEDGIVSAQQMFNNAQDANTFLTWMLRLGGIFALFVGSMLFMSWLTSIADYIPIVGPVIKAGTVLVSLAFSLLLGSLVIGLGWIFYRPLLGLAILVIGVLAAVALGYIGKRNAPAPAQTARAQA